LGGCRDSLYSSITKKNNIWLFYRPNSITFGCYGAGFTLNTLFDRKTTTYQFKWKSKKKVKFPQKFVDTYQAEVKVIDVENYFEFIG
jgi:hypothetical protein